MYLKEIILERSPIFFNVLTGSIDGMLKRSDNDYNNKIYPNFNRSPRWYSEESDPYVYEPYILVSAPHNRNKPDIRTELGMGDDTTVFVDSGGFQLATGAVSEDKFNREIALEWSEKNGDIFPILDMPVSSDNRSFQEVLQFSIKSAQYYQDNRTNSKCRILNVLSANRYASMEHWYKHMKDFEFDGWAYGGHKNYSKAILQSILFLEMNGEFNKDKEVVLHMFGTTSFAVMPYLIYAQHILNKKSINCQITFDSSSASALANYGKYILACAPSGITNVKISNKDLKGKVKEYSKFQCYCPYCQDVDNLEYLFSDEGKWQYYAILALHNYFYMLQFKRNIESMVSLDHQSVLDSFPTEMRRNFATVKKAFDKMGVGGIGILETEFNKGSKSRPIELSGSKTNLMEFT